VRAALRAILGQNRDLEIVGEAVDGNTATSRIMAANPHVVLVDIGLPGVTGIEVTRQIKERAPHMKVLMFTSNEFDRDMFEAFTAGADGYVIKRDFQKSALENAIRGVMKGKCWLDPSMADRVKKFSKIFHKAVPAHVKAAPVQPLTSEEEQVLDSAINTDGSCSTQPSVLAALQRFAKGQL
jgi:DNA-binding NarL/FixJ family response regulator